MNKVIIKCKTTESSRYIWKLLSEGLDLTCDSVPGGYNVDPAINGLVYIGVFSGKITLYFNDGETK